MAFGVALTVGKPLFEIGLRLHEKQQKRAHFKRMISIGIAIVVVIAIALITFSLIVKIGGASFGTFTKMSAVPVASNENGITNMLVLGQGDEKGIDLTDAIMVVSIDPENTQSVMALSLPRDLYFLHTDSMETENGKLNLLWRDNRILIGQNQGLDKKEASALSIRQLADEIGNALDIEIHHTVKVDFEAFEKVVDAIGGLDIEVAEEIHDEKYPAEDYKYQTFHLDVGMQHIDGATALKYVRTRSTTSDFDRSRRQQQVMSAAISRAKESGFLKKPHKILELFSILSEHIETDLKTRQMVFLANIARGLSRDNFATLQLNNVNGLYGDQLFKGGILYAPPRNLFEGDSVLLPVSIPEFPVTWKQIRFLSKLFFTERKPHIDSTVFTILNGGAPEGSAGKVAREFKKFGFDLAVVSNTPNKEDVDESFISVNNDESSTETMEYFSNLLGIPAKELPDSISEKAEGNVTIVLGKDFEFNYFQNLNLP